MIEIHVVRATFGKASEFFIFAVFNLLQGRDAYFHAQLTATRPNIRASADDIRPLHTDEIEMALKNFYNCLGVNQWRLIWVL